MAEEADGQDGGAEASGAGVDPAAMALALGSASRNKADRFLEEQTALAMDQRHHLREQFKQLKLNIWQQRMGVLLRVAIALVGLALAGGAGLMVWSAASSNGLIIEPFAVPPDMAAKGFSGEVVAAKLQDRLTAMQAATSSTRSPRSYANDWGAHGIKVEIPEAGISLAELDDFLRARLGNDIRVSGEIVRTDAGLSLTVRAGDEGADTVSGKDGEMDALVQKLAESIYRLTQPYRYGVYLEQDGHYAEARPVFMRLVQTGSILDRAYGYNGLSDLATIEDGFGASIPFLQRGLAVTPDFFRGRIGLADDERIVGREEESLRDFRTALTLLAGSTHGNARPDFVPAYRKIAQAAADAELGAFHDAVLERNDIVETAIIGYGYGADQVIDTASEHDGAAARTALADYAEKSLSQTGTFWGQNQLMVTWASLNLAYQNQDWRGVLSQAGAFERTAAGFSLHLRTSVESTLLGPLTAIAQARLGDFAGAEATLAGMPDNCYRCMIAHARVAELRGEHERANWWFARAVAAAPSLPFANQEWGQALLERGQPDPAIAKFTLANQKGPHFADALEGWGEALIAKKDSGAAAKFAEAEKYASNWGRLHLKWGEALVYAGQKDDAQKQFALAVGLDLSETDKAELAKVSHG